MSFKNRNRKKHSKRDIGNTKEFADHRSRILEGTIKGLGRKRLGRGLGWISCMEMGFCLTESWRLWLGPGDD